VRRPFEELVEELIFRIGAADPSVRGLTPREAIFRLARDIRFTRDKTPYKLFSAAVIAPGGRKQSRAPGFYFEIGADRIGVAGGIYQPDKETLLRIRRAIASRGAELERLLAAPRKDDDCALARQRDRTRLTDAAARARHPRDLAFEVSHVVSLVLDWSRGDSLDIVCEARQERVVCQHQVSQPRFGQGADDMGDDFPLDGGCHP